ncbi:hypothetical protein GCM10023340_29910 [Nocardioides marinquilinus]|uniref:FtsX-like permease family protein n=1 Tax=Nocardioides marinquilinus TaxID=1210400 RepID=A0ABP9PTB4_9ACTN
MRGLRSLRAHAGGFAVLTATTAALVAGVVAAVTVLDEDGGRPAAVLPLLVLGLVMLPTAVVELSRHRRDELALARVRGAHGTSLVAAAAGLAVLAAVLGGGLGALLGTLGPSLVVADAPVGATGLTWAAAVTAGVVVLVAGCAVLAVREPLTRALRREPWRPLRGLAGGLVAPAAAVLVGVAALVVLYQALTADADAPEAGVLLLAGSGVLAVAAGQLAALALRLAAPAAEAAGASRSVGTTLGLRRAVAHDRTPVVRAVVAAAVVAVAALSAASAADAWAADSTRLEQGAPLRADLPDAGALDALLLTRRLDPDGRWLMAAAVGTTGPAARERVAWLDLERYDAVAGAYLDDTGAGLGPLVARLRDAPAVRPVVGDALVLTVGEAQPDAGPDAGPDATVSLDYVDDDGFVTTATLDAVPGDRVETPVAGCTSACVVVGLSATGRVAVDELRLGDDDLLAGGWVSPDSPASDPTSDPASDPADGPLVLPAGESLVPADGAVAAPVVTAGAFETEDAGPDGDDAGPPQVTGIGGDPRVVAPVAERDALPLVVGSGVVGDLPVGLAAARGSTTDVAALVLARADTPDDVLAGLAEAGGEVTPAPPSVEALGTGDAAQARALRLVGLAAVVLGLLALLAGAGRRLGAARRETAALRLVGVPRRERVRAALVESVVLGATTLVAAALAGWLTVGVVVDATGLVPTGADRLPFGTALAPALLLAAALGAALLVVVLVLVAARVGGGHRSAPRRLLADEDAA